MAAIDFPNTPSLNQVFTSGSRSWIWTGTTWDVVGTTTAGSFDTFLLMGA